MQLIFANPAGWWGLLMLPALVLIHSLHLNRQPQIISTLFLVRSQSNERRGGRTFVFWKHSVTFWLQVLVALLITWLLLQPRWISPQASQRIAIVLDSSVSMSAYTATIQNQLRKETQNLSQAAARTHWLLLESGTRPQVLYNGTDRAALLAAVEQWQPSLGSHDWTPAIRTARALAGSEAAILFVTDHPPAHRPQQIYVLSVGAPIDNVGFAGLHVEKQPSQTLWRTVVKNYSDQPIERQWWIEIGDERLPARTIRIPADGSLALTGAVPQGAKAMTLVLEEDAWAVDNRLPFVVPEAKPLRYRIDTESEWAPLHSLLRSLGNATEAGEAEPVDLYLTESASLQRTHNSAPAQIFFAAAQKEPQALPSGQLSANEHPLNEGLNWNSLALYGNVIPHTLTPGETPLVWLGSTPLIWLRKQAGGSDLVFNFSLQASNALKLPATVLLLHRFAEKAREAKPGYEAINAELGQLLRVSLPPSAQTIRMGAKPLQTSNPLALHAPVRPAFFDVSADDSPLLNAAAHFADIREADFRHAAPFSDLTDLKHHLIDINSEAGALSAWWLLLLTALLLASWHYAERGR